MCRNIRTLHNFEPPATADEVEAAALQYVRKVSGSTKPSRANQEAFDRAVVEVAQATTRLLDQLVTPALFFRFGSRISESLGSPVNPLRGDSHGDVSPPHLRQEPAGAQGAEIRNPSV